jgi:hypothetical protein
MFALLIPLVLKLAPQLAGMIFGSKGADATAKVAAVVQAVVGDVADLHAPGGVAAAVAHLQSDQQASTDWQRNSPISRCRCRRSRMMRPRRNAKLPWRT